MCFNRKTETVSRAAPAAAGDLRRRLSLSCFRSALPAHPAAFLTLLVLSVVASQATAAPYTPDGDHVILARLPAAPRALVAPAAATSEDAALSRARAQIEYASREEDPRFLGYAEATLTPYLQRAHPAAPATLLMARIEQQRHQFARARLRLKRMLEQLPNQGQAWLMLANIERVQGRLEAARQACRAGANSLPPATVLLCQASVQAITDQRDLAYRTLQALAASTAAPQGESARWLATLSAEIALQQGRPDTAMVHVREALDSAPDDPYLRYLQSDVWLALDEPRAVIDDLNDWQDREGALLRLAIAAQQLDHPHAGRWRRHYQMLMAADQDAGRQRHLREHARFVLEVEKDARRALSLAQENWQQQRELADLRVLHASARASDDEATLALLGEFINQYQVVDSQIPRRAPGARE